MKNPLLVPELREYIANNNIKELKTFCESGSPPVIADFLSALTPNEVWEALRYVSPIVRAEIFSYLDEYVQVEMADTLKREDLARILSDMSSDDRVDLLKRMPEDRREYIIPAMAQAEREDIRRLSAYQEGTAGAVMTSEYATLGPHLTAREAIDRLRREAPNKETIYYAYVVDESRKLVGYVSLKDLILAKPEARIQDILHNEVVFVHTIDDQEDAARKLQKYDLIALPVIDSSDALVGIITHDDAIDIITQEHTEDMEKMMAISGAHESGVYLKTPAWVHFKNRAYWIVGLAAMGLISGLIIHSFESSLMNLMILAFYMPMIADTGGHTGSQSATVVVRALALKEITPKDARLILLKEFKVGILLALILAILSWGKVMFLSDQTGIPAGYSINMIGLVIAIALGIQAITATLVGAILPIVAVKFGLDPAIVASPALTTIVDITGLTIYFTTAKLLLNV
ncbi:MAG: magnesium transporter [Pseudomonadota bacterium]